MDNLQSQVYEAHRQLNNTQSIVTAETLKNKFLGKEEKGKMLIEVFKEHNKKVATLVGYINPDDRIGALDILPGYALLVA